MRTPYSIIMSDTTTAQIISKNQHGANSTSVSTKTKHSELKRNHCKAILDCVIFASIFAGILSISSINIKSWVGVSKSGHHLLVHTWSPLSKFAKHYIDIEVKCLPLALRLIWFKCINTLTLYIWALNEAGWYLSHGLLNLGLIFFMVLGMPMSDDAPLKISTSIYLRDCSGNLYRRLWTTEEDTY